MAEQKKKKSMGFSERVARFFIGTGSQTERDMKKHNKALQDAYNASGTEAEEGEDNNEHYQKIKDSDLNQD